MHRQKNHYRLTNKHTKSKRNNKGGLTIFDYTNGHIRGGLTISDYINRQIPLAPMGVLALVSAHAGHSAQPPIDASGNFPACVSAESIFSKFPHFPVKIGLIGGVGGIPQISFSLDS